MKIAVIKARYDVQPQVEAYLASVFGRGNAIVKYTRGHFQCTLPRGLYQAEIDSMRETVEFSHYE
ncbi:hypothetical protein P171DRAFT_489898 [Karstenula rhodostoma CBS 690.94]|uniref:Uncharacterized protein n=1 Tax=Karstenula rhodostoma CBS 690.94 TaxID=1392251 RepID=A0A9P4U8J7_9PLEO|nr:hypothetical protein P171DRAFT_489898 [Karstenula rhodostoma CBS 690.94]